MYLFVIIISHYTALLNAKAKNKHYEFHKCIPQCFGLNKQSHGHKLHKPTSSNTSNMSSGGRYIYTMTWGGDAQTVL